MSGPLTAPPGASARARPGLGAGNYAVWWSLTGVMLVSLAARIWYVAVNPLSYDETHNLMIGMLAHAGYAPYREIYSVIAPFALLTMQVSAAVWGATPAVRTLLVVYGLLGVAALFFIVRRQVAPGATLAATLAALFYSFNPYYFAVSTSLNLEAGALAFALLSVAALELFRTRRSWVWVLLSGMAFGLSIAFKIFVPYAPAVIGLQLLLIEVDAGGSLRHTAGWLRLLRQGLIWLGGVIVVVAVFLLLVDARAYLDQVIDSRFELRAAIESDEEVNIAESISAADLVPYLPPALGALLGVITLVRLRLLHGWVWVAWLVGALAFLVTHDPVRPRHTITVLPALAALSGIGLGYSLTLWAQVRPRLAWGMTAVVLIWTLALPFPLLEVEGFIERHPVRQATIDLVRQTTTPDDCVIAKENRLHFLAGRLSTPHLSLISTARLFSGLLPAADIMAEAAAHDCPVLVYSDTFDRLIPDLRVAAGEFYALHLTQRSPLEPDYVQETFAVPLDTSSPPPIPADVRLGDQFRLAGWWLTPEPVAAGAPVQVATYWQALRPPDANYKIFLHWLDDQGERVAAFDHYPFELRDAYQIVDIGVNPALMAAGRALPGNYPAGGMLPTQLWPAGATLKETHTVTAPQDLPPGLYTVVMGMYDEASMARLPVFVDGGSDDQGRIVLGQVEVR